MAHLRSALAVLACVPTMVLAQGIAVELDSPVMSKYVWRGLNVVDGPVWQPSFTASLDVWSLNLWGNFEIGDATDYGPGFGTGRGKFTEFDTTLAYSASSGDWDWSVGYIRYDFPNTGFGKTSELFASLTRAGAWSQTLEVNTDVDAVHGTYAKLGVGRAWETDSGEVGLDIGIGFGANGHNAYYFGSDKAGLVDLGLGLTYTLALGDSASFTVYGNYASLLDKSFVPGSGRRDNFVFGVGVTFGF